MASPMDGGKSACLGIGMNNTKRCERVMDGLVGADHLTRVGGMVAYRIRRLAYPDPDKQEELAAASVNRPSSDGISEVPEKNSA